MKAIKATYRSLLADVAQQSGFSEIRGFDSELHWGFNEAPQLEKLILESIETGVSLCLDAFPDQLKRIAAASVIDAKQLRLVRQLLLFANKAHVPHDKTKTAASFKQFVETNSEVQVFGDGLSRSSPRLLDLARKHVQSVLYRFDEKAIVPFHGPGASLTPKVGPWRNWYESIEYCYPYSDYFSLYQNREQLEQFGDTTNEHIKADVIAVPKDSRGPRLICIHPAEAIWIQQGLRVGMERAIDARRSSGGPWPKGHVLFDDQSVNGRLALSSSKDRKFATLDMKEASDRLSEPLIQILFGRKYKWFGCCRAQKYHIRDASLGYPDGDIACYAPMGNATTFPVQSLVFWAICVASMQSSGFHQPDSVFVFGDDLVVPTECAERVIDDLETFGLLVNRRKSFYRGSFRESCGVDAYKGIDVTPVRWRIGLETENMSDIQALSDMAMRLRVAGYEEAAATAYANVAQCLPKLGRSYSRADLFQLFRTNDLDHGGIAEYVTRESAVWDDAYWHKPTQQFVSPVWRYQEVAAKATIWGWNPVLESVCSLERTGRSNVPNRTASSRSVLKLGWTPIL